MATVLETDYAWADDRIERLVIGCAGHGFVAVRMLAGAPPLHACNTPAEAA